MINQVLSLVGRRTAQRGLAMRAARGMGLPFGGFLPIAAYFAWKHRDEIRAAVSDWRQSRSEGRGAARP